MSSPKIKNISLFRQGKSGVHIAHPVLLRRASAVVTDVGRVAVDAEVATDDSQPERTVKTRGPDARMRRIHFGVATVATEPRLTGESAL